LTARPQFEASACTATNCPDGVAVPDGEGPLGTIPYGRKETSHMRRTLLALAMSAILALFAGCASNCCNQGTGCHLAPGACYNQPGYGRLHCDAQGDQGGPQGGAQQGGPAGVVSWPYYTVRGPRDFLETHPQSIGP
jgi:hypothetical protein